MLRRIVMNYKYTVCGYVYNEADGAPDAVAPGTAWADVSADFTCPLCGAGKDLFAAE